MTETESWDITRHIGLVVVKWGNQPPVHAMRERIGNGISDDVENTKPLDFFLAVWSTSSFVG